MPRIVHVKKAQQRFEMVPVLSEDGTPKRVPVINKQTGEQKVSKRGPVFMSVTVADKSKPLPMPSCDARPCRQGEDTEIKVGSPYKHLSRPAPTGVGR